jgi:hypothetical protein
MDDGYTAVYATRHWQETGTTKNHHGPDMQHEQPQTIMGNNPNHNAMITVPE